MSGYVVKCIVCLYLLLFDKYAMQVQSADYVPASCARPYFLVNVGVCDDVGKRDVGSASCAVGSGAEASSIGFRVFVLSTSIRPYCPTYISFIRDQPSQLRLDNVLEFVVKRGNSSCIQQRCNRMCS